MTPRSRRTTAAAIVCGATALTIIWLAFPPSIEPLPSTSNVTEIKPTLALPSLKPIDAYAAISEHQLFAADRKPYTPPPVAPVAAPAVEAPTPVLGEVTLLGVVIAPQRHEAVLRSLDGATVTVAEGETYKGWTLDQVLPDHITLHYAGTVKDLAFPAAEQSPASLGAQTARLPGTAANHRFQPAAPASAHH